MSNLLEKASIITTPTAYSDGFLHSVKPEQTLGSELITNGDFATDSDWSKGTGWTISGGTANCDGTQTGSTKIIQSKYFQIARYQLTVTVSLTAGTIVPRFEGGGANNFENISTVGTNTHVLYLTITGLRNKFLFRGDVNFIGSIDNVSVKEVIDADFTFTRNDAGTRVNSSGIIESVGVDLPRIDYTDGVGSWLLEPQSQNLYQNSEPTSSEAAEDNVSYEPFSWANGFTNCVKYVDNSVTRYRYGGSVVSGNTYTLSAFVIMDDLSEPIVSNLNGVGDFKINIGNNTSTGVINSNKYMGNNIWRVSKTSPSSQSTSLNGVVKFTNNSAKGFRVVGWQLEEQPYATSVIPTSGSPQTRGADSATDAGSSDLISSTEGVLYAEIAALSNTGVDRIISISDGSNNNTLRLELDSVSNKIRAGLKNIVTPSINTEFDLTDVTEFFKVAVLYNQNDLKLYVNGALRDSADVTAVLPANTFNRLSFNRGDIPFAFEGKVKCVAVFKEELTDAELTCLTTI